MVRSNKNLTLILIAILFFLGIIFVSYSIWVGLVGSVFVLLIIYVTNADNRFVISIFIAFLISFFLFQLTTIFIDKFEISRELKVLINRGFLLIIIVGLSTVNLLQKRKISFFIYRIKWSNPIAMPFHSIKLSYFMLIGVIISAITFIPFIVQQEISFIKSIIFFGFMFSIINATLEELIWRGVMLTSLKEYISVTHAVIITSVGFGLSHLIVGMPFMISLLFSFGGLFYGLVVIKTNSIYPAIIFHFIVNIGMVLSGLII